MLENVIQIKSRLIVNVDAGAKFRENMSLKKIVLGILVYALLIIEYIQQVLLAIQSKVNESKDMLKRYGELWKKIKDLIRSITNSLDNYDRRYMKNKLDLDDNWPLMLELHNMIIIVRSIFHECKKYYPQVFLDE